MRINLEYTINAPLEAVWHVIGDGFADIGAWATPIPASRANATPVTLLGAPVAGRACDLSTPGFSTIHETLVEYDPLAHRFTFTVDRGLPQFVTTARNSWALTPLDATTTHFTMRAEATTHGVLGYLATPFLWLNLRRTLRISGEDLVHFVESGTVSPRKARQLAKRDDQYAGA